MVLIVYAEDLPIDINAIIRQEIRGSHTATRVGANLFTEDAQRVNYALAEQVRVRQATASYLFTTATYNCATDPHIQLITAANSSALFAQPANFSNSNLPQNADPISMWVVIPIIALCAIGGFVWAMISGAKKKGQRESVY